MPAPSYTAEFTTELIRYSGPAAWTFAVVPPEHGPAVTLGWGRVPVRAIVDGRGWETSIWREKSGRTLLAVPKRIRGSKGDGDTVCVRLEYSLDFRD